MSNSAAPIAEPSGLGWLDGFDEMMVRCGLASNGAPEFDENGKLVWPLHGRIANLPASEVHVNIDENVGRIAIRGTVYENRFHIQRLQLQTEISLQLDSDEISIAGFDDLDMSSQIKPALTTVYVPSAEMGENAAEYLVAKIRQEPLESPAEIETKLMVRETTAQPRAR